MKQSLCHHVPSLLAQPRSSACEAGDKAINLRVCLTCGHVGCCDSSPGQHARKHAQQTGHQVMAYFPASPESPRWCYAHNDSLEPELDV